MSENSETPKKEDDGSLAIPVIWGVGAGLFVAVLTRGVLAGGIVVVLALIVFGAVVLSARPQKTQRASRRAPARAPLLRRGPPKPPAKMTQAAMERSEPLPPAVPGRPGDWLRQVHKLAIGRDAEPDGNQAPPSKE